MKYACILYYQVQNNRFKKARKIITDQMTLLQQMYRAFYYECRSEKMSKKQAINAALILHQLIKYLTWDKINNNNKHHTSLN